MVNLTRIYTRTGDAGTTRLGDFSETSKTDTRLAAYADVDETNATIGVALTTDLDDDVRRILVHVQNDLFDVGADLCTPVVLDPEHPPLRIEQDYVDRLEGWCDRFNEDLPTLRSFILNGGTPSAAHLHLARTVCRRAERSAWAAWGEYADSMNPLAITYLNRLSDLLFILARHANRAQGDVLWVPGGERSEPTDGREASGASRPMSETASGSSGVRRLLGLLLVLLLVPSPALAAHDLPPTGTDFDYQLGGDAALPDNVGMVVRDRTSAPADGVYDVCYVNGFQTQSDQKRFWHRHWRLVLKRHGAPVVDAAWGEWLLDIRTRAKRHALARIMGRWTRGCAADGYAGVEYDNLDSFSRSHGLISRRDARRYAAALVRKAHRAGLAAGQKNWAEWDGTSVGYDFAIAEECGRWHECGSYVAAYGDLVYVVEYRRRDFRRTCRSWGDQLAVVLRDRDLTPDGVHDYC